MASFGFSLGDFITVGLLAANIYNRCKAAVLEFKDLSREVTSMQIVLDAIGRFWTEEEARGHDLDIEQKNRLKELAEECKKVLQDIGELLNEHRALARGSKRARMRWVPIQINPIRNRLILFTTLLATLNNTITANSQANSQARVLEALNIIQRDLWEGKRRTSAVSRVTIDELCDDRSEAWQNITTEIGSIGVDAASVAANQQYIRAWIDQVILEEADGQDQSERGGGSPPWPASATPPEELVTEIGLESSHTEETAVDMLAQSAPGSSSAEHPRRPLSFISHRSKSSTWRPIDGPNPDYVQGLLAKLLQSAELIRKEDVVLSSKRIFHQLDWWNQGFLYRPTIEDEIRDAVCKAKMVLSDEHLEQLVLDGDKNMDGVIDRDEFVVLISELLALFKNGEDEGLRVSVTKASDLGMEYCKKELTKIFADKPYQAILPWGWKLSSTKPTTFTLDDGSTTFMTSARTPQVDLRSFRVAALVIDRLCVRLLVQSLKVWHQELIKYPSHIFDEYQRPIDDVLKVASGFVLFARRKSSSRLADDLDELVELLSLIVNVECTGAEAERAISLLKKLSKLRDDTFSTLRLILGFVTALGQLLGSDQRKSPPSIDDWRKQRMQTRANHIHDAYRLVLESQSLMDECLSWLNDNRSLSGKAYAGLQQATTLRAVQVTMEGALPNERHLNRLKQKNKVKITVVNGENIPKSPRLYVYNIKAALSVTNPGSRVRTSSSQWIYHQHSYPAWDHQSSWDVVPQAKIAIGIYYSAPERQGSWRTLKSKLTNSSLSEEVAGRTPSVAIGDIVGDLSKPGRYKKTLALVGRPSSTIHVLVEAEAPQGMDSDEWACTTIHELMMSINRSPLPEGWEKMTTPDGRTYFRDVANKKNTIAYNLSTPVQSEFLIPNSASS